MLKYVNKMVKRQSASDLLASALYFASNRRMFSCSNVLVPFRKKVCPLGS